MGPLWINAASSLPIRVGRVHSLEVLQSHLAWQRKIWTAGRVSSRRALWYKHGIRLSWCTGDKTRQWSSGWPYKHQLNTSPASVRKQNPTASPRASVALKPFHSQEWWFKFPLQPHQKHNPTVWRIWLHSSIRWKMIILPISVHHLYISLSKVGRMYFLKLGVKGLRFASEHEHSRMPA